MTDCPNCEYHKKRAQLWRDEAYKQAGHPLPEREWVGLTDEEITQVIETGLNIRDSIETALDKLKEKNT